MAMSEGSMTNGTYEIDPDGPGGSNPISVQCVVANETVWSHLSHNLQTPFHIQGGNSSYKNKYRYKVPIVYNDDESQVKALVAKSASCRMHFVLDCFHVVTKLAGWVAINGSTYNFRDDTDACLQDSGMWHAL